MPIPHETGSATDGSGPDLVAVRLPPTRCVPEILAAWEDGQAVAVLDPSAPTGAVGAALGVLRPTHVLDEDGLRAHPGGEPAGDGVAAVVLTSGTTGTPKAVELTRDGLLAMGRGYSAALGADPARDRWLACLPLHHVAGLGVVARSWVTGVPLTVHDGFDPARVAAAPTTDGATLVTLVPTTLARLLDTDADAPGRFRRVVVGGAPTPPALRARAEAGGAVVADAYGQSETWGGCVIEGRPNDGVEIRLATDSEILVRGAPVMRGYRFDQHASDAAFVSDGLGAPWLRTGDAGVHEDGRLRVTDRRRDVIVTGGVNVSPTAVEDVLATHPAIVDVCVVGQPDAEWGERVVAYVVATDRATPPSLDALRGHARDRLAPAQLPREVVVVDAIPRTPGGKARRQHLRRPRP